LITVSPITEVQLTHRATHLAVAESGHVAAISWDGAGTLLAPDHITSTPFSVPAKARDTALSAQGSLVAVTDNHALVVTSTATSNVVHREGNSFEGCCFSPDSLWSIRAGDGLPPIVEIRDTKTWKVVARSKFEDRFGGSSFMMRPHPDGRHAVIWAAAGQDGQNILWARRDGSKVIVERFRDLDDTAIPCFLPSDDRFLTVCEYDELRAYKFPQGPLLGKLKWPSDEMENKIGDFVSFVDADRALVNSEENRLYLIDLVSMEIVDEVSIRGRESDLCSFESLPTGSLVSVHGVPRGNSSILTWRVPELA
jgi:hypothetical protein